MTAITGIGVLSRFGAGRDALLEGLRQGQTGFSPSEIFGAEDTPLGEVKGFRARDLVPQMKARRMGRLSQLALGSAVLAVEDSGLDLADIDPFRVGVICGTGLASTGCTDAFYTRLLENGPEDMNPIYFPETVANVAASQIAIHFGLKGPNTTFCHNETSSELALSYATRLLESGQVDAALVTGSDELSHAVVHGLSYICRLTGKGMRPFGGEAGGFVLAEGGATLVLERLDDARKRPYARVSASAFSSAPARQFHYDATCLSMEDAMKKALAEASLASVDMVSASANGMAELDNAEASAINRVFPQGVPVVSLRAYTGFFLADGALRVAATALCMREGLLPGAGKPAAEFRSALVNSFGSGGSAASIALTNVT